MPFTKKDLQDVPIWFVRQADVWVTVGPCSASPWNGLKIPLDGRQYKCGGKIIFRNGNVHQASFTVNTTRFDFLETDSVYLAIGEDWYNINEPELLTKLNLTKNEIFPFTWLPDRPLDYHIEGPYSMKL
jgi:hypothetical protein